MQTTKTLEDKNHVKPWNRAVIFVCKKKSFDAEASRWVRSSVPFYRAIWLNRRQGILWEGLGLSLPTRWISTLVVISFDLTVAKDMCLILIHPETKVENLLLTSHMLLDEITLTILMYVGSSLGSALMYTLDALLTSQTEGYRSLIDMAFLQSCHGHNGFGSKVKNEEIINSTQMNTVGLCLHLMWLICIDLHIQISFKFFLRI